MQGPVGKQFVLNTLAESQAENVGEAQNMLCRLDARYGKQREKTEAYVDVGLGVATLTLAAIELASGAGMAAALPTATVAASRLQAAVNILKITGGNLAETFDTISFTIRERVKMEGKIKAMMSQALRQGMMLLAFPPIMLFMLKMNDPVMFNNLVSNFMGWVVLAIVVACELVAYVMIIKITKIDI